MERSGPGQAFLPGANSVLIVEDDEPIRELIGAFLTDEGFEVTLARDGQGAVRAVRERIPDLILLDVHLPDGESVENLMPRIRACAGSDVPLVVMSASHQQGRAAALGACGFVPKPFELEMLLQEVRFGLISQQRSVMGMRMLRSQETV